MRGVTGPRHRLSFTTRLGTAGSRACLLSSLIAMVSCGSKAEPSPNAVDAQETPAADPRAASHLERSLQLEQQGDLAAALAEADAAIAVGGGRDASVQAAKLAILRKQYDRAITLLTPVIETDSTDAVAQYNLALARQRTGDYNGARNGYLAALRADPRQADARYNLAVLCFERGIHEEARHHVAKFLGDYADDPRGANLERMVGPATER
jgi:tetratricopeptide (TPR) repeat protein